MKLFRTILVPADLTATAASVHASAFALARYAHRLRFLYVDTLFGSADHAEEARRHLAALGEAAPCPVETLVVRDLAPATAILQQAALPDVDLVALGTHGRRGLSRLLLGSTAREVVQHAPCPVLTARPDGVEGAEGEIEGGSILVAVDFTEASEVAVREAVRLAEALGAWLDVIHVVQRLDPASYAEATSEASARSVRARTVARVRRFVHAALRGTEGEGFGRVGAVEVEAGAPADVVVRVALARASGLLVIGTKGLRGLRHLVAGSIAEAVVRAAPCPVLTVKTRASYASAREALGAPEARTARPRPPRGLALP